MAFGSAPTAVFLRPSATITPQEYGTPQAVPPVAHCCGISPRSGRLPLVLTDTCSSPGATTGRRAYGPAPTADPWASLWCITGPSRTSVSAPTARESQRRVLTARPESGTPSRERRWPRRWSMPAECGPSNSAPMAAGCLTASDDQTARLWALPSDKRPLPEIRSDPRLVSDLSPGAGGPSLEERWFSYQPMSAGKQGNLGLEQSESEASDSSAEVALLLRAREQARTQGDLCATVRLSTRLCELATDQWTWFFDRAYTQLRLHDYEAAAASFRQALQIEPHAAVCWLGRYLARSAASDPGAAADLRAALERAQSFSDLPREQIVTPDPSLPEQWEAIVKDCTDDLRTAPQAAHLLCARGTAEAANTRLRLAKVDFERALELRPGEIEPHLGLAVIYRNQAARTPETWQKVAEAASRALAFKPNDPLAQALRDQARQHLQSAPPH